MPSFDHYEGVEGEGVEGEDVDVYEDGDLIPAPPGAPEYKSHLARLSMVDGEDDLADVLYQMNKIQTDLEQAILEK
jgi:hypothetical protein